MTITNIDSTRRAYRLTGITPILGSQPANPEVRTAYIASKAPSPEKAAGESNLLPEDMENTGLTVFLRDPESDALGILSYVLQGYLKEALQALQQQNGIKSARAKVDKYLFAYPLGAGPGDRFVPFLRDDVPILEEDSELERILRAETMQGPRTTPTASEQIEDPWSLEFELELLPNGGTAKSKALEWDAIEQALDYGRLRGLGQWRNAGYGRFTWARIDRKAQA